jgi:hypothetical protein
MSIGSVSLIENNIYEFDINIKSLDDSFVLTSYQVSLSFNQDVINNGVLTFSYIEGTSQLQNKPSAGLGVNSSDGSLELTFASLPGIENINTQSLRVGRFRLVNSNPFSLSGFDVDWDFEGVAATILTGENFSEITNPSFHISTGATDVKNSSNENPENFMLNQNYPNPFNPSTSIRFTLPSADKVKLTVYTMLGEVVEEVLNRDMEKGTHQVVFNGESLASGIYIYKLDVGDSYSDIRKMNLVK